jgi:hypothetical protein
MIPTVKRGGPGHGRGGSSGLELDEPRSVAVLLLNFLTAAAIARPGRGTTLTGPRFSRSSRSIRISRGRSRIHEAHCERARDYKSHNNAHEYLPLCGAFHARVAGHLCRFLMFESYQRQSSRSSAQPTTPFQKTSCTQSLSSMPTKWDIEMDGEICKVLGLPDLGPIRVLLSREPGLSAEDITFPLSLRLRRSECHCEAQWLSLRLCWVGRRFALKADVLTVFRFERSAILPPSARAPYSR